MLCIYLIYTGNLCLKCIKRKERNTDITTLLKTVNYK